MLVVLFPVFLAVAIGFLTLIYYGGALTLSLMPALRDKRGSLVAAALYCAVGGFVGGLVGVPGAAVTMLLLEALHEAAPRLQIAAVVNVVGTLVMAGTFVGASAIGARIGWRRGIHYRGWPFESFCRRTTGCS